MYARTCTCTLYVYHMINEWHQRLSLEKQSSISDCATLMALISLFSTSVARLLGRLLLTLPVSEMRSSAAVDPGASSGLALLPRVSLAYIFLAFEQNIKSRVIKQTHTGTNSKFTPINNNMTEFNRFRNHSTSSSICACMPVMYSSRAGLSSPLFSRIFSIAGLKYV